MEPMSDDPFADLLAIARFVSDRLDDDAHIARQADGPETWRHPGFTWSTDRGERPCVVTYQGSAVACVAIIAPVHGGGRGEEVAEHIARHDTARVLAEVAVDRDLLTQFVQLSRWLTRPEDFADGRLGGAPHEAAGTLKPMHAILLTWVKQKAAIWADHPDYREEWRP